MIIKIEGTRQQIAELAHDIRMEGFRFNHYLENPLTTNDRQSITLVDWDGTLHYYKKMPPKEVYADKRLQVQLPTHREYFLKQIRKSYAENKLEKAI